jgi:hypothetical protein
MTSYSNIHSPYCTISESKDGLSLTGTLIADFYSGLGYQREDTRRYLYLCLFPIHWGRGAVRKVSSGKARDWLLLACYDWQYFQ